VGTFLCIDPSMQMEKCAKMIAKMRAKMIAKMHAKNRKKYLLEYYKPNNNNKKSKHDARPAAAQATAYVPFACTN